MKRFAKILSLLLAFAIFSSTASIAASVPTPQEKMTDICLVSTEDYFVMVSVPESKAVAYQERLASDCEFFQAQLQEVARSSEYPGFPGIVVHESYMYKEDIKQAVDAVSGAGSFNKWLSRIIEGISVADIAGLITLSRAASVTLFVAGVMNEALSIVQQQREEWWTDSLIAILEGDIRAVKYVIIQNTTDYPKIWRLFVRV